MFLKSGYSFLTMLVINPVLILLYQQCSMIPASYASKEPQALSQKRELASAEEPTVQFTPAPLPCTNLENCIKTKIK